MEWHVTDFLKIKYNTNFSFEYVTSFYYLVPLAYLL